MHDYTCIILDINLPDGSGLELLTELKKNNKADGVLIISAHMKNLRKKLTDAEARDYIKSIYGLRYKFSVSLQDIPVKWMEKFA